jgi:hypothetical protein
MFYIFKSQIFKTTLLSETLSTISLKNVPLAYKIEGPKKFYVTCSTKNWLQIWHLGLKKRNKSVVYIIVLTIVHIQEWTANIQPQPHIQLYTRPTKRNQRKCNLYCSIQRNHSFLKIWCQIFLETDYLRATRIAST